MYNILQLLECAKNPINSDNIIIKLASSSGPFVLKYAEENKNNVVDSGGSVGGIGGIGGIGGGLIEIVTTIIHIMIFGIIIIISIYLISKLLNGGSMDTMETGTFLRCKNTEKDTSSVKFNDVAGLIEAKKEVEIYVDIMKNREKYIKMGAKLPKGFLMIGPPGCGKTLLAKAIAGEAGVNFISANGSEFDEMYVGVGASRVRKLFKRARDMAPCIVFIDEIDGIGSKRGQMHNGEHDKTLNNLLTEMDGFNEREQILCIGATNRLDILDEALTRSGRFDQHIVVDPPSVEGRAEIFKLYIKKLKFSEKTDHDEISNEMAKITPGVSGADIANICNQSAIIAVTENNEFITIKHMRKAVEDVCIGGQRKSRKVSDKEKKIVAYHECGHAILGYCLKNTSSPLTISIIPRGAGNLGYTMPDYEDKMLKSKQEMIEEIGVLLGGRIAEEIFFSAAEITGGASNDIEKATNIAYAMCTQYGMSKKIGMVQMCVEKEHRMTGGYKLSSETMTKVDNVVKKLIDDIYIACKNLVLKHKDDVIKLADHLIDKEELKKKEISVMLGPDIANKYGLTDIDF